MLSILPRPGNPQRLLKLSSQVTARRPVRNSFVPFTLRAASTMLKDPSLLKQDVCYVNGQWVKAKSGKTFEVHDPATGKLIGTCPEFDGADTEKAIAAAAEAFKDFRHKTGRERSKLLRKWYDLMMQNAEDLTTLITWENGKPLADAKGEVTYAANFFEWFSEEAPRIYGNTIPSSVPGNRVWTIKEPAGVCGLITPWNFPAAMVTRKIGPALATGCTVVAKAPAETPFTSLALAELAHRAGIPAGVVNVVTSHQNTPEADAHVRDATAKGAKVLVGGNKMEGSFFEPTVLTGMTRDMAMAEEETFGPVAGIFPFDTEAEVVAMANSTTFGLAGYFFSKDLHRVHRVAEALEVGMVGVNTGLISDPAAPFGGVKESGFGREGSLYGVSEYQITKMVTYGGMGQPLQA
ncbi:succinate-semialdehyde dehydrogenase [Verticillium dahliae VdLs.17]|uniref:Succinate-semialdehyde dehydrogenase n=1 Tax=Verticillium dahliae (strain VdLs.17 / ATCC MYA-4575 / FGSC 10137) TaxID=498257 RepID=G2X9N1_VERDV|nr:succinate-semialdehyde dehydrogenase [Verticillium dahliae VdLs.17]EGY15699.1 succinate-semialdehyde dehydrogenase [Verticillium dahliae VdLs.17]